MTALDKVFAMNSDTRAYWIGRHSAIRDVYLAHARQAIESGRARSAQACVDIARRRNHDLIALLRTLKEHP